MLFEPSGPLAGEASDQEGEAFVGHDLFLVGAACGILIITGLNFEPSKFL